MRTRTGGAPGVADAAMGGAWVGGPFRGHVDEEAEEVRGDASRVEGAEPGPGDDQHPPLDGGARLSGKIHPARQRLCMCLKKKTFFCTWSWGRCVAAYGA